MLLKKDKRIKKTSKKIFGIAIALILFLVLCFYLIITCSGTWLVQQDEFSHVKWVAVLDGQGPDLERTDLAAKLLREHRVDSVLILGRRVFKDHYNAEFYADDLMKQGHFDSNTVFLVRHDDASTLEEARTIIPWFKSRNADTVLLVTAMAASKRVARIFNTLAGGKPHFIVTNGVVDIFYPESWLINRENKKTWAKEWGALFLSYLDLWNADTLSATDSAYLNPIRSLAEERRVDFVDLQKMLPSVKRKIDTLSTPQPTDSSSADTNKTDTSKTTTK